LLGATPPPRLGAAGIHNPSSCHGSHPACLRGCELPALGLSISLLAINNVEHRHDKPQDSE
ncbi:hypothetical protein KUCAC02_013845, partial [Chaenocephalus aceratus]